VSEERADRLGPSDGVEPRRLLNFAGLGRDLIASHPTRVRWHAITGVALTGLLISHTLRRSRRLANSTIG
jgi:hypothetical protein